MILSENIFVEKWQGEGEQKRKRKTGTLRKQMLVKWNIKESLETTWLQDLSKQIYLWGLPENLIILQV